MASNTKRILNSIIWCDRCFKNTKQRATYNTAIHIFHSILFGRLYTHLLWSLLLEIISEIFFQGTQKNLLYKYLFIFCTVMHIIYEGGVKREKVKPGNISLNVGSIVFLRVFCIYGSRHCWDKRNGKGMIFIFLFIHYVGYEISKDLNTNLIQPAYILNVSKTRREKFIITLKYFMIVWKTCVI